jgi:orotate phosphoribosyltransferase
LCKSLAEKLTARFGRIDVVAGPAVGGIIPGYEIARHLGARAIFAERVDGKLEFRRGFSIGENDRVLIAEDIVTTGLSFRETVEALAKLPGTVAGGACIIDRSGGRADVGCELVSLAQVNFPDYAADALPPELAAMPAVKPGSRGLA